jgi:hypothetical protein
MMVLGGEGLALCCCRALIGMQQHPACYFSCSCHSMLAGGMRLSCSGIQQLHSEFVCIYKAFMAVLCISRVGTDDSSATLPHACL